MSEAEPHSDPPFDSAEESAESSKEPAEESAESSKETAQKPQYVKVEELKPENYDGTCLRPLGLCDLGGCCDICWYRPTHPRFKKDKDAKKSDS